MPSWKTMKLLPKIKKYFGKLGSNNKAVLEAAKAFDKEKGTIEKDIEEKKTELQHKMVEIYRDSKPETKLLLKEPSQKKVKEQPQAVQNLLQKISEAGFPGSTVLKETSEKLGTASMAPQINYLLAKISPFVAGEEAPVIPKDEPQGRTEITDASVEDSTKDAETTATDTKDKQDSEPKKDKPTNKEQDAVKPETKDVEIVGSEQHKSLS